MNLKNYFLLAFLLLCATIHGQNDTIWIDPIEQSPQFPTSYSIQQNGNWGYNFLQIPEHEEKIKELGKNGRPVVFLVFDTGGKASHSALANSAWPEHDMVFTGEAPEDGNGHSTHVAGIIAGTNEAINIGVTAPLVKIGKINVIYYKVLTNSGFGTNANIYRAIRTGIELSKELIKEGYFVIWNFSLGRSGTNEVFNSLFSQAEKEGVLIFGASGNDSKEGIITPANGQSVQAIGALNPENERAYFSNWGSELFMMGPGTSILSTYLQNSYRELSGTSMATPHMAGIAGIIACIWKTSTNLQIKEFLQVFSEDIKPDGWDSKTGHGVPKLSSWFKDLPIFDTIPPPGTRKELIVVDDIRVRIGWKPLIENKFRFDQIKTKIKGESYYQEDKARKEFKDGSQAFFSDHTIQLNKKSTVLDAAYWAKYFFNKHNKKLKIKKVSILEGEKEVSIKRSIFYPFFQRLFNPEIALTKN